MMHLAEAAVMGQTQKGGPAATMQSAATRNEKAGLAGHDDATAVAVKERVTITETDLPGRRIITRVYWWAGGQYIQPTPVVLQQETVVREVQAKITIGEALEAAKHTAGSKPLDQSDAAAIRAAEVRATGTNNVTPGGLTSPAQLAVSFNAALMKDDEKVKLTDVLSVGTIFEGATSKLPVDKPVTKEDAEGMISTEMRNNPNKLDHPPWWCCRFSCHSSWGERGRHITGARVITVFIRDYCDLDRLKVVAQHARDQFISINSGVVDAKFCSVGEKIREKGALPGVEFVGMGQWGH
ncbi:hypothetical protein LguiA_001531 [Lonicera macranthoides]